jgi:hypothetical protein
VSDDNHPRQPPLAVATDLSSFSDESSFHTPTASGSKTKSLDQFFINAGVSPPVKVSGIDMNNIVESADNLLKGIGRHWGSMTQDQQVKFSFLLHRNQHMLLQQQALLYSEQSTLEQTNMVARAMWDSLDLNTLHGPMLQALVQKGGDVFIEKEAESSHYETFLEMFPEWENHATHPSIFNNPKLFLQMDPLMRFQSAWSTVCYMIAVAGAIHNSMCLNTGTPKAIAVGQYAVNISRYMRNEFSDQEIFDNAYLRR